MTVGIEMAFQEWFELLLRDASGKGLPKCMVARLDPWAYKDEYEDGGEPVFQMDETRNALLDQAAVFVSLSDEGMGLEGLMLKLGMAQEAVEEALANLENKMMVTSSDGRWFKNEMDGLVVDDVLAVERELLASR